ncbi:hypothetical protein BS47DRAFT_1337087 [Hydnum rufescens UP504]|uniref:Uncharacterized protein n=1 Tax=Hydnum rufescens UP504 TaxID=1448309 RepID=A0A9P6B7R8_9AGAM|nr:hypothetical protein BS47DRAFT_1337087 [Hydnum rufescens UP504]
MSVPVNSPYTSVFLLHIALEIPLGIQGVLSAGLPFIEMTNTTLVVLKLYGSLIIATCIASLLCFGLPDMQPGKRAVAIMLIIYHCFTSTVLIQSPRFIPMSFGNLAETFKITPEVVWGTAHGIMSLFFVFWWQATLPTPTAKGATRAR